MIPKRTHSKEDHTDSWLMSYADMITLLMCFFIIFVSVSEPKKDKMAAITDGLANQFGTIQVTTPFAGAYQSLLAIGENRQLFKEFSISKSQNGLEMELATSTFYKPDSAELNEEQLPALAEMAAALKKISFIDYRIAIEAHTSDAPTKSGLYPTNWELSSAQASRLVRYLIEQGIPPERLKAVGYADSKPKVPNRDANNHIIVANRETNQRIVIIIERVVY